MNCQNRKFYNFELLFCTTQKIGLSIFEFPMFYTNIKKTLHCFLPVKVVCVEVCETGWQEGSAEFWVCDKYHGMPTIHGGDELEGKRGDEI